MSTTVGTPGIYRLVSTVMTTGAKNGAVNDNITFNTNIPSLDYAIRIWRTRFLMGWVSLAPPSAATFDIQAFAQLTENQTKTSILPNDTSYLDEAWVHYAANNFLVTAVGQMQTPITHPMEI